MSTKNASCTAGSDCTRCPDTRMRRWTLALVRRVLQRSVLALFIGTARLGWKIAGEPLLSGDFSASLLAGTVPFADPFAVLQKLAAGHPAESTMLVGALIILVVYALLGGRVFCGWMCPMNMVTDAAAAARSATGLRAVRLRRDRRARYVRALVSLIASVITGAAAFEWVSPQAFLWREAVWGVGLGGIAAVLGVFAFDLAVLQRGWCGHLCPLGAFWSLVGNVGLVKPIFRNDRCTRCGDCLKVCPEPQVLNCKRAGQRGMIASGECTNCGRCAAVCPENAIFFAPRFQAKKASDNDTQVNR